MKALILASSPRRDGNSAILAQEVLAGLQERPNESKLIYIDDVLGGFLRDCRKCRKPDGECSIEDGFRDVFINEYLNADGVVFATPIYWYGMSAQLKAFFDRMFCYAATSHPLSEDVVTGMMHKRFGLVLSSEETYPGGPLAIISQIQEFSDYTESMFVGVVHGRGNARGDVKLDPENPVAAARRFGQTFFTAHATNYKLNIERSKKMWREKKAAE